MPPLTQAVIDRLQKWCKSGPGKGWGRQTLLARHLRDSGITENVTPQIVTDWFSTSRKRNPTAEQILAVIRFLDDQEVTERLQRWCDEGDPDAQITRKAEAASMLKVPARIIDEWFLITRTPTANQIAAIAEFLDKRGAPE